jgi:hypothetical protein
MFQPNEPLPGELTPLLDSLLSETVSAVAAAACWTVQSMAINRQTVSQLCTDPTLDNTTANSSDHACNRNS